MGRCTHLACRRHSDPLEWVVARGARSAVPPLRKYSTGSASARCWAFTRSLALKPSDICLEQAAPARGSKAEQLFPCWHRQHGPLRWRPRHTGHANLWAKSGPTSLFIVKAR